MLESEVKALKGRYPNIVFKKKLTPLPLFNQNRNSATSLLASPTPTKDKSIFGAITPRPDLHSSVVSPTQPFLNGFKTVNNYGRLCDQPFLEFSNFHSEQVFGSGGGKKKIILEPIPKKKQKITKMFTLRESLLGRSTYDFGKSSSVIKIQDHAAAPQITPQITINHKPKEKVKDQQKQKEEHAIIKKVYKIGDYEAVVGFYSLEVLLTVGEAETQKTFALRIGKDKLKKIFKFSHSEMTATVLESLRFKEGKLKMKLTKEAKQDRYIGDETYPEKKENLTATIDGQEYKAAISFPHLEVSISKLGYTEKVMLKPLFLANLFEENFNNLQDYIQKFTLPDQVTKTKEEIHLEELKKLPTILKKVVKTADFGGLVLFKSLEVHLKNTSALEPETIMHESSLTPMNQKIMRKKKKDVSTVLLRLRLDEVLKLIKCSAEEITEFVKESICVEEGTGFAVNLDKEKLHNHHQRKDNEAESFPEYGEKFTVRFNRFIYEGFIKFPTLELYIPETNYKDVIQLKPYQLRDLIEAEFENIEAYLHYFKKPNVDPAAQQTQQSSPQYLHLGDETPREFAQSIEIKTQETPMAIHIPNTHKSPIADPALHTQESETPAVEPVSNTHETENHETPMADPIHNTHETEAPAVEPSSDNHETPIEEPIAHTHETQVEEIETPVVEHSPETHETPVEDAAHNEQETETPVVEPSQETHETPIEEPIAHTHETQVEETETPVIEHSPETHETPVEDLAQNAQEAEIPVADPSPENHETPVTESVPHAHETPVEDQAPNTQETETPVVEPSPENHETPVVEPVSNTNETEIPVVENSPETHEAPVEESIPNTHEAPVEDQAPNTQETEIPVVDHSPENHEAQAVEPASNTDENETETPAAEHSPETYETPVEESIPNTHETPVEDQAPNKQETETPAVDHSPENHETQVVEPVSNTNETETPVVEHTPEKHEAPVESPLNIQQQDSIEVASE